MPTIEQLEPANKADVLVYMPYYTKDKHSILPYAITLYRGGSLEGRRRIENSEGIPFVASWYVSKLPSELTRCRLQFEGQADLSYEMTILNAELIEYLIGAIKTFKQLGSADFSQGFYRKLLQFE
ncbi:MAG: hypothetical protein EWV53_15225 [Microcystis panniformis Mp_MB_F_20051200_S9]|uniref:Uncharacterized protein n=1 Tax=Microcystis panniformis Mp_MB_F_20051200_S9 TaxID=2486223 RepID=A0A552PT26_9CHRO|nr:MAG: hypothetical protein EWV43_22975 [Microcystis panniformis Mp_MB_F_20080800_S26D]TRV42982.1 MAG: hypothetical protein EWV42_24215 [Microcystis panniformis Mp_GB_SS_20050300_S99D]TRV43254.1 MAG: hypothetical protein EWV87_21590 [Microcystis panniformis Mp_GB_SS_20050300_S99]TRV55056.1 MAG: hypothetical protein EWV69_21150 [Microcystis panniformis Mp_MB_F_20080800_S26]TRV60143.1 MAG: hypothetical protein EWV53_15225 [Microcystis panniformis Mp_MB_F_20051200_S9]TRV65297.1 MAG: hypothetical